MICDYSGPRHKEIVSRSELNDRTRLRLPSSSGDGSYSEIFVRHFPDSRNHALATLTASSTAIILYKSAEGANVILPPNRMLIGITGLTKAHIVEVGQHAGMETRQQLLAFYAESFCDGSENVMIWGNEHVEVVSCAFAYDGGARDRVTVPTTTDVTSPSPLNVSVDDHHASSAEEAQSMIRATRASRTAVQQACTDAFLLSPHQPKTEAETETTRIGNKHQDKPHSRLFDVPEAAMKLMDRECFDHCGHPSSLGSCPSVVDGLEEEEHGVPRDMLEITSSVYGTNGLQAGLRLDAAVADALETSAVPGTAFRGRGTASHAILSGDHELAPALDTGAIDKTYECSAAAFDVIAGKSPGPCKDNVAKASRDASEVEAISTATNPFHFPVHTSNGPPITQMFDDLELDRLAMETSTGENGISDLTLPYPDGSNWTSHALLRDGASKGLGVKFTSLPGTSPRPHELFLLHGTLENDEKCVIFNPRTGNTFQCQASSLEPCSVAKVKRHQRQAAYHSRQPWQESGAVSSERNEGPLLQYLEEPTQVQLFSIPEPQPKPTKSGKHRLRQYANGLYVMSLIAAKGTKDLKGPFRVHSFDPTVGTYAVIYPYTDTIHRFKEQSLQRCTAEEVWYGTLLSRYPERPVLKRGESVKIKESDKVFKVVTRRDTGAYLLRPSGKTKPVFSYRHREHITQVADPATP